MKSTIDDKNAFLNQYCKNDNTASSHQLGLSESDAAKLLDEAGFQDLKHGLHGDFSNNQTTSSSVCKLDEGSSYHYAQNVNASTVASLPIVEAWSHCMDRMDGPPIRLSYHELADPRRFQLEIGYQKPSDKDLNETVRIDLHGFSDESGKRSAPDTSANHNTSESGCIALGKTKYSKFLKLKLKSDHRIIVECRRELHFSGDVTLASMNGIRMEPENGVLKIPPTAERGPCAEWLLGACVRCTSAEHVATPSLQEGGTLSILECPGLAADKLDETKVVVGDAAIDDTLNDNDANKRGSDICIAVQGVDGNLQTVNERECHTGVSVHDGLNFRSTTKSSHPISSSGAHAGKLVTATVATILNKFQYGTTSDKGRCLANWIEYDVCSVNDGMCTR
jgi:hypothetical protein